MDFKDRIDEVVIELEAIMTEMTGREQVYVLIADAHELLSEARGELK